MTRSHAPLAFVPTLLLIDGFTFVICVGVAFLITLMARLNPVERRGVMQMIVAITVSATVAVDAVVSALVIMHAALGAF